MSVFVFGCHTLAPSAALEVSRSLICADSERFVSK
jgi:hypothetical protein